ncbi:MAG: type pilin [Burkholderiales bacterium]|jgi:type II secretory pathway pseudopilin PulG|nr:type pilin [Burkholderiales bacterium]
MEQVKLNQNRVMHNNMKAQVTLNRFGSRRRLRYAGFNAIELSLVLGVIAIAIVGVIRVMGGNTDKQNSSQMVNDVSIILSNVKNAYSSSTTGYSTLTTEVAIQSRIVPQDLKISTDGKTVQNQFQSGVVEIASGNTTGDNFTITYTNVPQSICSSAINTMGGSSFLKIDIGSGSGTGGVNVYDVNAGKMLDAKEVAEACSANKEKSTIVFTAS